jgi:hypothetical protein
MPHLLRSGSFLASRFAAFGLASLRQCCERQMTCSPLGGGDRVMNSTL